MVEELEPKTSKGLSNAVRSPFSWTKMLLSAFIVGVKIGGIAAVILIALTLLMKKDLFASPQIVRIISERAGAGLLGGFFIGVGLYSYSIEPKWICLTSMKCAAFCGSIGLLAIAVLRVFIRTNTSTTPLAEEIAVAMLITVGMMFLGIMWSKDHQPKQMK